MKNLHSTLNFIFLLIISLVITTCAKENEIEKQNTDNALDPNPIVVKNNNLGILVSLSETQLTFSDPTLAMQTVGNGAILVSGISENAPYGYLRRVISKSTKNGNIILNTETATLNDLFTEADIKFEYQITPSDTIISKKKSAKGIQDIEDLFFKYKIDKTINDQIKISGELKFKLIFDFEFAKEKGAENPYKIICKISVEDNSKIECKISAGWEGKIKCLPTISLAPIEIWVPVLGVPIPVIFYHELNFYTKAKLDLGAKFDGGVQSNSFVQVGIAYENGSFKDISETQFSYTPVAPNFKNVYFEGKLSIINLEYNIKPYGLDYFKGFFSFDSGLKFNVKSATPNYMLGLFGEIKGGVKTNFWGFKEEFAIGYERPTDTLLVGNFVDVVLPIVSTNNIENINQISATCGGNISNDGGAEVTARGICWSTNASPTISDNVSIDGSGIGSFTSQLTGLLPNTTYHVRSYAINSKGTAYGNELTFKTLPSLLIPTITTTTITNITETTAQSGGTVTSDGGTSITSRGVCWSTAANPTILNNITINGTGNAAFTSQLTGLLPNTKYYVRSYAINSQGTGYGNELSFTTNSNIILPSISTTEITSITENTAQSGGVIINEGSSSVSIFGICWNTSSNPTIADNKTSVDVGAFDQFQSTMTGLLPNTTYYVRSYAINSQGTGYGNELSFTTLPSPLMPTITTTPITNITTTTAQSGGAISSDGGAAITARGVCWSTSANPTIINSVTIDGTGNAAFTSQITGLLPNTKYYIRSYAINSKGTGYGNELSFTTNSNITSPTITTTAITGITSSEAIGGGNISSDGGAAITARGICWSTSANPSISASKTTDGLGTGIFASSITGLTANTTYYVRAYATNSLGTYYGNELSFTTNSNSILPSISTTTISGITVTTAQSGGVIISEGSSPVTIFGICWNTAPSPTLNNNKTIVEVGEFDQFQSTLTALLPNTTYYVRAYATSIAGTGYGNELSFTTNKAANDIVFNPNLTYGSVTDIEGNVYKTIQIGTQTWMAQNLKVTEFNDYTSIPNVTNDLEWSNLITPAYCWSNNNEAFQKPSYGALYNSYVIDIVANGNKNICPVGWHIPTYEEWNLLSKGESATGGGRLKETGMTHWHSSNSLVTNESGFTALPTRERNSNGSFVLYSGYFGYYMCSTKALTDFWAIEILTSSGNGDNSIGFKSSDYKVGYPIRCIKD